MHFELLFESVAFLFRLVLSAFSFFCKEDKSNGHIVLQCLAISFSGFDNDKIMRENTEVDSTIRE